MNLLLLKTIFSLVLRSMDATAAGTAPSPATAPPSPIAPKAISGPKPTTRAVRSCTSQKCYAVSENMRRRTKTD